VYRANVENTLFPEINKIIKKNFGIDVIENVLHNLGNVELAFVTGDYAKGIDGGVIDLVIVGKVNKVYMNELIEVTEKTIKRKIRVLVLNKNEYNKLKESLKINKALLVWSNNPKKVD
jgi:hypothetical protein